MDGPCSILDCGYDTHPRPPSFHFSFSVRVIDFGWRPQCTVNSFCILTSVASVSSWMSKPIDDLNLISTIQLSSKHLSPVVSAWLWWTSVHLSHSSCWLVRYPNTCSCPLYDCFLLKPPLQSHSHTLPHSGPWGHICPIWMTSLYPQCRSCWVDHCTNVLLTPDIKLDDIHVQVVSDDHQNPESISVSTLFDKMA